MWTGRGEQLLVLADQTGQIGLFVWPIGQQDGFIHRGQLAGDGLVKTGEVAVDQHHAILGVVHGVENLLRRQAHVDRVHHRANHRDGEHALRYRWLSQSITATVSPALTPASVNTLARRAMRSTSCG